MSIDRITFAITAYQAVIVFFLLSLLDTVYHHPFRRPKLPPHKPNGPRTAARVPRRGCTIHNAVAWVNSIITIPARYWGVRTRFFELATLVREAVEIALQSVQAYQCSHTTFYPMLNIAFGLLIPLNCFSSPLIQRLLGHDLARERALILAVDLVIDIVWFLLPLLMMAMYFAAFLSPDAVLFRDTFFARARAELPFMLITSYADLAIKLVPAFSVWLTVRNINKLLHTPVHQMPQLDARIDVAHAGVIVPSPATDSMAVGRKVDSQVSLWPKWSNVLLQPRVRMLLHSMLILWGLVMSVAYIVAVVSPVECENGCKLNLRPWFVGRECVCAVQVIDCFARNITGEEDSIQPILSLLNPRGLRTLIFTHCPQLVVPSILASSSRSSTWRSSTPPSCTGQRKHTSTPPRFLNLASSISSSLGCPLFRMRFLDPTYPRASMRSPSSGRS